MQGFTFQRFQKLNKINKLNPLFTYSNTQIWDLNCTQTQNAEREREGSQCVFFVLSVCECEREKERKGAKGIFGISEMGPGHVDCVFLKS